MNDPPEPGRDVEEVDLYESDSGLDIEALRRRRELVLTFLALLLVLASTIFTAWKLLRTRPVSPSELSSIAALAIRQSMPGLAIQIGGAEEMWIKTVSERAYEVSGRFYVVNERGQLAYYVFTCRLEQRETGSWRPVRLTVTLMY